MRDSDTYLKKKKSLSRVLTIYGRKPVLEALQDNRLTINCIHLADSNKDAGIIDEIQNLARARGISLRHHSKEALSRISKNKKQDQGVAADLLPAGFQDIDDFIASGQQGFELIALDRVTNPQNLGMIIRSVCASPASGLLLPEKGCAKLDALVIKASAGTIFKANIIRCETLAEGLQKLATLAPQIVALDLSANKTLADLRQNATLNTVFILGNETDGVTPEIASLCNQRIRIPMQNGVESLNVAVTAALISFRT